MAIPISGSPGYPYSFQLATNQGFPWPFPQIWQFAITTHRTQENTLFTLLFYYKAYYKGYMDSQWKRYMGWDPEVSLVQEILPLWGVECSTLPIHKCIHQPWKLSEPHCLGFLWRFHYAGMIDYIIGSWD